jgi:hypothetical protein
MPVLVTLTNRHTCSRAHGCQDPVRLTWLYAQERLLCKASGRPWPPLGSSRPFPCGGHPDRRRPAGPHRLLAQPQPEAKTATRIGKRRIPGSWSSQRRQPVPPEPATLLHPCFSSSCGQSGEERNNGVLWNAVSAFPVQGTLEKSLPCPAHPFREGTHVCLATWPLEHLAIRPENRASLSRGQVADVANVECPGTIRCPRFARPGKHVLLRGSLSFESECRRLHAGNFSNVPKWLA